MAIETEEDFVKLIQKAEREAETSPRIYTIKLALFALYGYLVILLVLGGLLGLVGGLVATAFFSTALFLLILKKKLILAILPGIWVLLRALWIKFDPPRGYSLKPKEFPKLFAELDSLSKNLESLKVHEVILDRNLNAAVVQHPRLGVFGWHKNYLVLGYQLLLALSPEEMRSVLAHEFGHLSGNHSRFSGWIYRVRLSWLRVMEAFDQADSFGGRMMRRFFDWYSPHFDAYSFALARSNEYDADAIAAELTSAETATRALVNVYATAPYLDQSYWDNYIRQADEQEQPPHAPFKGLSNFLRDKPLSREDMLARIKNEMEVDTHYADTHPSLKDRVNALGAAPQVPVSPEESAAEAWLGPNNGKVMERFDQEWLNDNGESWQQRFTYVTNAKKHLQQFSGMPVSELSDKDLWNYAYWTDEFETSEAALPLFRAYQERYPDDPDPAYFIGITLLNQGDADGLDQLRVARNSSSLIEQAARAGYSFLIHHGDEEQAQAWWRESIEQNRVYIAAREERDAVTVEDVLLPPRIDDNLLQQLIASLKTKKNVAKVWLAQKQVRHFPENPVYVIAFAARGFHVSAESVQDKVAQNLGVEGDFFVVCKSGNGKKLAKKIIKVGKRII